MGLRISLGQMDVILGRPEQNIAQAEQLIVEASRRGSNILVLPELWSTGYDLAQADKYATSTSEGVFAHLAQLAQEHQLYILGSCLSRLPQGGFGNTAVLHNPQGQIEATYSKLHLFRLMDEEKYLTGGHTPSIADTAVGKFGLTICYDLRFPELFRNYALAGVQAIFIPAEWPHPRLAHWQTLLRARAIENQLYMIACNRVGQSQSTFFFGHSCIIDPWGNTVIEGGETAALLTIDIDLDLVRDVRQRIPIFADRRPELY